MAKSSAKTAYYKKVGVIGGGAWGTALALVAAEAGRTTLLWAREPAVVESIGRTRQNAPFLPGIALPETIRATTDLAEVAAAEALLLVVPAQHLRTSLAGLVPHLAAGTPLVLCAKGIERGSGQLLTEVLLECAPAA